MRPPELLEADAREPQSMSVFSSQNWYEIAISTLVTSFPISFTAAANSGSRRRVMKTYAPSFTNWFAVARGMPLLPPVTSAIFPSSLLMYSLLSSKSDRQDDSAEGGDPQPGNSEHQPGVTVPGLWTTLPT